MEEEVSMEFLDSIEKRMEDCRNQFEQYFLGSRRTAPLQDRTSVQFQIRKLSNYTIPNTRTRFRFQQIVAKFNSYNQYWNRTLTQIEEGRYYRDRFKMKLHSGAVDDAPPEEVKKTPPKPKPASGNDANIDQVFKDFVAAKKQLNQATNISRDKIAETINKQLPELQKRYQGKQVSFKVVVEDGKAKIKATVK